MKKEPKLPAKGRKVTQLVLFELGFKKIFNESPGTTIYRLTLRDNLIMDYPIYAIMDLPDGWVEIYVQDAWMETPKHRYGAKTADQVIPCILNGVVQYCLDKISKHLTTPFLRVK